MMPWTATAERATGVASIPFAVIGVCPTTGAGMAEAGMAAGARIAMSGMARLASAIWRASRCAVQPS